MKSERGENPHISLEKSKYSTEEIAKISSRAERRKNIGKNLERLRTHLPEKFHHGILTHEHPEESFTVWGSQRIKVPPSGASAEFFGRQPNRLGRYRGEFLSRGPRYFSALDRSLSVPQKLKILQEDFEDGARGAAQHDVLDTQSNQYELIAPMLDYAKNGALTLFHSLVHFEKSFTGNPDSAYFELRNKMIEIVQHAVRAYYLCLLNLLGQNDANILLGDIEVMREIAQYQKKSFADYVLTSRAFVRPEASHPLIILSAVGNVVQNIDNIDSIVGMPAGGTEFACALQQGCRIYSRHTPALSLVPITFHSEGRIAVGNEEFVQRLLREGNIHGHCVVVDDNASTGRTLQRAHDLLVGIGIVERVNFAVAEADVVRSELDRKSQHRTHIAHPSVYEYSAGILPISKTLKRKYDIKEIMETRQLVRHYRDLATRTKSTVDRIKFTIFADEIERPTEETLLSLGEHEGITTFQGTFLSNFYGIDIEYQGTHYPSVEHAYQAAKFSDAALSQLSSAQIDDVNELLRAKGYLDPVRDIRGIFTDTRFPAGSVKEVADRLRTFGIQRSDWDDIRVNIMIELESAKFADEELRNKLINTGDSYLIEGNEWNDTYWGICAGRGKNFLGRILMAIRADLHK